GTHFIAKSSIGSFPTRTGRSCTGFWGSGSRSYGHPGNQTWQHNVADTYGERSDLLRHAPGLVAKLSSILEDELETRILEFIGDAHYALGAMAESTNAYGAAASRAAQTGLKAAQVSALTSLMRPFGLIDPDQGLAAMEQAVQVSRSADDPVLLARTQMLAASCRL